VKAIKLTRGYETIVDDEDYESLIVYRWYAHLDTSGVYACRTVPGRTSPKVRMNRQIMGLGGGTEVYVDHINGDTLDNRRCNLRLATNQQNQINRVRPSKANRSGFTGVIQEGRRWLAYYHKNGKQHRLGLFDTPAAAFEARQAAIAAEFGQFSPRILNAD